uniref:Uncharacterized protein n=2 Tax=viral metagenome TaxID=1070528 RepID=A0A6M3KPA6_9ZZZZ
MKTMRDCIDDAGCCVSPMHKYPTEEERERLRVVLDYPVIESSGVVLAVDREKLREVACACFDQHISAPYLTPDSAAPVVDAILTSMAEQGWREVEHGGVGRLQLSPGARHKDGRPMEGAWVVHWDAQVTLPMHLDCGIAGENRGGREVAVLKPLPPAKEVK